MAVAGLAGEYGLWEKLKNYPALDPRTDKRKGFDGAVYVAAFAFGFCSGAKSISDVERLDADPALKALLGAKRFPDQSALGEWLRNIGEAGIRELRLGAIKSGVKKEPQEEEGASALAGDFRGKTG